MTADGDGHRWDEHQVAEAQKESWEQLEAYEYASVLSVQPQPSQPRKAHTHY